MTTQSFTSADNNGNESGAAVMNGGLILLNPFFTMLFNMCGYLSGGQFKDEGSAFRAVHLLQYLATGKEHSNEHELILNKLLCGVAADRSVGEPVTLLDAEKQLCHQLLKAAIAQWQILGQTTTEGLREAFINRKGILKVNTDTSTLVMEHKPFDMLLDRIPWVYNVIKFSWMQQPLYTKWR